MPFFLNLTLLFLIFFIASNLLIHLLKLKQNKKQILSTLKCDNPYKKSKFKNSFMLSNLNIYVNNKLVKNYKFAFGLKGIKLIKNFKTGKLVIQKISNNFNFKTCNLSNVKLAHYGKEIGGLTLLNKTPNLKQKVLNYHYGLKHTKVVNLSIMQSVICGFTASFLSNVPKIVHSTPKTKQTQKTLNQKIVKPFGSNAVLIKNHNQPLKNIFNFKITSVKQSKNKLLINNAFVLEPFGIYLKISKLGANNLFNFSQVSSLKIKTKNLQVNGLINNILPNKIVSEFLNNFCFIPFSNLLNIKQNFPYHFTHVIAYLKNNKQYINLYNFLLTQVVGIGLGQNEIYFYKPQFYLGIIKVSYQNIKLLVNNNIESNNVLYKGIVYSNVPSIKTTKTKVYNID